MHSVRRWYYTEGKEHYPRAKHLYLTGDSGGANGSRVWQWKWELQKLANELRRIIHVSHYPPGTSKWHAIEHEMFSYSTSNWRARPLTALDEHLYETKRKIPDAQMATVRMVGHAFHPEWNYSIYPIV